MALWQVSFLLVPSSFLGKVETLSQEALYRCDSGEAYADFELPSDYAEQVRQLLPEGRIWHPKQQIWGSESSDDLQIWLEAGRVVSIEARVDVGKLDSKLLRSLLNLAECWLCVLVERRYRTVCRMNPIQLRMLIAGHPHSRAMKEPDVWLSELAHETRS